DPVAEVDRRVDSAAAVQGVVTTQAGQPVGGSVARERVVERVAGGIERRRVARNQGETLDTRSLRIVERVAHRRPHDVSQLSYGIWRARLTARGEEACRRVFKDYV